METESLNSVQREAFGILCDHISIIKAIYLKRPDSVLKEHCYIAPSDYGLSVTTFRSLVAKGLAIETHAQHTCDSRFKYRLAQKEIQKRFTGFNLFVNEEETHACLQHTA